MDKEEKTVSEEKFRNNAEKKLVKGDLATVYDLMRKPTRANAAVISALLHASLPIVKANLGKPGWAEITEKFAARCNDYSSMLDE